VHEELEWTPPREPQRERSWQKRGLDAADENRVGMRRALFSASALRLSSACLRFILSASAHRFWPGVSKVMSPVTALTRR
jgi:hypothetical protein